MGGTGRHGRRHRRAQDWAEEKDRSMSIRQETRVALVGAGYVSAYHIRALQTLPHVRIVGIADASLDRARAVATRFAIPGVFTSLAEMRTARPDVVHVLTPPSSHAQIAIEA